MPDLTTKQTLQIFPQGKNSLVKTVTNRSTEISTTTISYIWATGESATSLRLDNIQNKFPGEHSGPGGKLPSKNVLQRNYYYTIIFQVGPNRCLSRENQLSGHN